MAKAIKRPVRRLWKRYLRWPAPLWRLQGYASLDWGGYRLKFRATNQTIWWLRRAWEGKYETEARLFLVEALEPGDVFFDVGAWVGPYSLLAAKLVQPGGWVYSFEPDPLARRLLECNLEANRVSNVTVLPYGVTDRKGVGFLDSHRMGASESRVTESSGLATIQTVSLKAFCEEQAIRPSVIKIDVEGGEAKVFAGGINAIQESKATVVEVHEEKLRDIGVDPSTFLQSLFDLNKRIVVLHQKNGQGPASGSELTREAATGLTGVFNLALVSRH